MRFKNLLCAAVLAVTAGSASAASFFVGDRSDFRDETIYFTMTTRFYDGDPSNNTYCWDGVNNVNDPEWRGDFKGLIEKMDYIKALGFTAIWVTPVVENCSGLDYHGYHAINMSKVDPRYESTDVKFQDVIDEAHKRGMKIILDVVLQHTGNFGEETLCPMFTKNYNIPMASHSNINKSLSLHPQTKLPSDYYSLPAKSQYEARLGLMKNTRGINEDTRNLYHHYAHFNWDNPERWWGQIAGDCVDLNTENAATTNYVVKAYTNFINMGVDGFRIDTSGHIARLSFNKMFIPQFQAAAEAAKDKRGGTPFFMFGEVCARAEEVIYGLGGYNTSPCFYTWKEEKDYPWDMSETSWDNVVVMEGETGDHINAKSVLQQGVDYQGRTGMATSDNAWLRGNEYHTPDYSKYSGFSVIDFPMHWRFYRASNAFGVHSQDNLYNDATWNVVYVDGHDYGPNGWDTKSFGGSLNEWAENLSLMFTFRGIPCIFQGSETYFKKGNLIDKGAIEPLANTARAYYGGYLTGSVTTTDFAQYTKATGNLAASLSHPLALHLQRLNKIRAAVPALRKGQYSVEGCSGTMAFKRRYKDANTDSYALITVSGNATFTGILNGTYTDVVTGDVKTVTDGTLSVTCSGQGNLRVYVLNGPGKIGEDGQFLYATASVPATQKAYDGNEEAPETTTQRDTEIVDPSATAKVTFSPNGGAFKTATLDVTATLNSLAVSGWYQIGSQATVSLSAGSVKKFTIGADMNIGDKVEVKWGATGADNREYTGSVVYNKVDPNAVIGVYVYSATAPNLYVWNNNGKLNGEWPGQTMSNKETVSGHEYWCATFDESSINLILNADGSDNTKTPDITNITSNIYLNWTGGKSYTVITDPAKPEGEVVPPPADGHYVVYFDNSQANWSSVYTWIWDAAGKNYTGGTWPGTQLSLDAATGYYKYEFDAPGATGLQVIFNPGSDNGKTGDLALVNKGIYNHNGYTGVTAGVAAVETVADVTVWTAGGSLFIDTPAAGPVVIYSVAGTAYTRYLSEGVNEISDLPHGFYIVNRTKVIL